MSSDPPSIPSFKEILVGQSSTSPHTSLKPGCTHNGHKALIFSEAEISTLAKPLEFCLVGKFPLGRPSVDSIRLEVNTLGFKQEVFVGILNTKCVLLKCKNAEDYSKLFVKKQILIKNFIMRIIKWNPESDFSKESPFYPIWIALPQLRLHFMQKEILISIGNLFGKTLSIDNSTITLSRPCVARILVEIDVSQPLTQEIWLGTTTNGYLQKVLYEKIPPYCTHCCIFGHLITNCFKLNPALRTSNPEPNHPIAEKPQTNLQTPPSTHYPEAQAIASPPCLTDSSCHAVSNDIGINEQEPKQLTIIDQQQ